MYERLLLEVENTFLLTRRGLVIIPDFPANDPPLRVKHVEVDAKVVKPSGDEEIHALYIDEVIFKTQDKDLPPDKRFRMVVSFPEANEKQVPIGSKVYVSKEICSGS